MLKRIFHLVFIACVALMLSKCGNRVHEYYVSSQGDDNNDGSRDHPFKTIQKINALQIQPGTIIYFKGGETFHGTLNLTLNGTARQPIIIIGYENADKLPLIDGGNKESILVTGTFFEIENLRVKGAGRSAGNTKNGITLYNVSNASVDNINIMGFQKSGIEVNTCEHVTLRNILAYDNGFCGIYVIGTKEKRSKNVFINSCHADNNPGDPTNLTNHSGNGILAGWCDSVAISLCTATNNGWDMPRTGNGPVGIWAYESDHVLIEHCLSFSNSTSRGGKDGGGFDLDGGVTNSVIQYCLSYDNYGAGYGLFQYAGASNWKNNIVRYCISINDATRTKGSGGVFVWNGSADSNQLANCYVYNNVIVSTHAPAVQFEFMSANKNFLFYNNIFLGAGEIINGPSSGEHFIANDWWKATSSASIKFRNYKDLNTWAASTGQEKRDGRVFGYQVDPKLQGPLTATFNDPLTLDSLTGFKLLPNSPLKNKGIKIRPSFEFVPLLGDFFAQHALKGSNPEPGVFEIQE